MPALDQSSKDSPSEVMPELIEKYKKALLGFKEPEECNTVSRPDISIRQHPDPDVEGYFEWVTRTGKPALPWEIIQPAFKWKVEFVLCEMVRLEKERLKQEKIKLDQDTEFKLKFIMERVTDYEGPPFTFQRICELLITPTRHYKKLDKYVRALDKNVNVVTTVTEMGIRITGGDWPMPENPTQGKVEQHFFGKVDELDGLPLVGEKKESKEESMVEIASVPFGPVLPSTLTPPPDEQMEPIDMTTKSKEEPPIENEPKELEMSKSKQEEAGDASAGAVVEQVKAPEVGKEETSAAEEPMES